MTDNISLPNLPSCFAPQVRAKLFAGIHLLWSARISFFHRYKMIQWMPILLGREDLYPSLTVALALLAPCLSCHLDYSPTLLHVT